MFTIVNFFFCRFFSNQFSKLYDQIFLEGFFELLETLLQGRDHVD